MATLDPASSVNRSTTDGGMNALNLGGDVIPVSSVYGWSSGSCKCVIDRKLSDSAFF